ncbi:MAG: hypothetical protein MUC65_06565, partial [Pontiellaceae bacterium]|nr:hypothetical protein [Pontiellaceae bacterium]
MNVRILVYRTLVLCLLLPLCCAAVRPYVPKIADPVPEPWRWRQEEELAGMGVLCMDEAEDGSLWLGCVGSIARYDGSALTKIPFDEELLSKITHSSSREVPWAKSLLTLKNNRLLVLIGESLVLRAEGRWRIVIQDAGRSTFESQLLQGKDGSIWLLVPGVLWRIDADLTAVSIVRKEPESGFPKSCCLDAAGNLWVVEQAQSGLFQLVQIPLAAGLPAGRERVFPIPFGQPSPDIQIASGDDGLIWYVDALQSSGLEAFDPVRESWVSPASTIDMRRFFSVLKSRDGSIWCGGTGSLLHYSRETGSRGYEHPDIQLPRVALNLFETRDGRLWVIGRGGYVYSMDTEFREWVTYEDLGFECETAKGVLWFTSGKTKDVVSFDPGSGTWLKYGTEDGLIDRPYALFYSSHGLVWAAGSHQRSAAIAVFDGVRWERQLQPEFASYINSKSAFEASDGTVWFGAGGSVRKDVQGAGGALQYQVQDDGAVRLLKHHAPPILPYYVTSMAETPDQQLWIGSTIIHRYDGTNRAVPDPFLQGENTVQMVLDQNQTLWAAKEHVGIGRRVQNGWTVYGTGEGLPSLLINDLCLLRDGSLLASSDQGVSRFDGKTWTPHAYPKWFGMIHPLSGVKESSDGSIWLNYSYNEMWMFNHVGGEERSKYAVRHRPETNPPETWIVECLKRVSQPGNTYVSWQGRDLWSRTPVEELQYSWRLDGGEWSAFSRETGKTFLKLDSGQHVMEVRARDRAFNIDPSPARVEFTVIPPIWRQAWFVLLISGLTGLIIFLVWILIRNRERYLINQQAEREAVLVKQQEEKERHLKEMDRLKTGFFTNISHELRTPMTVVSGRLQTIFNSEIDDKTKNALSIVLRNVQRVTTLITQLLDFRKIQEGKIRIEPTHGDVIPPLREWVASLQVLAEQANVSLSLECADECRGWFDFDKLQKICTN